ncbi:copper resistance protein CopC [Granulicella cerasi]|uniref:Copper resistance protein CopC n=1 Tax=Granulicella cerasi TaxID=741063 RepID=A0ABW1Z726_9BACT|nr:copper resistance protein CopC [Granulicella cerasi]
MSRAIQRFSQQYLWIVGFVLLMHAAQSWGQGCALCLDSTRATPPVVQAAYRHAIFLMAGAGATIFIAGILLFRRER